MLAQQGRTREALAHFVEAARVTPDDPDAHNNLGSVLAQIGQRDRAHDQRRDLGEGPAVVEAQREHLARLSRQTLGRLVQLR